MARPRVIVADTDESYVIPLQKKFAELFADKIDLEIITDKDYFNQLFSLSQHADILLVSDTLYNSGLKKHDIRHLMILSEHYEPGQTDELDICRLFKYTSVREIFNEITGRCKDTLYAEQDAGKETSSAFPTKGEMRNAVLSAAAFKPAFSYYPLNPLAILSSTFSIF